MAKVIYEPHPVTPERKRELREKGYTIVDARFAPDGYVYPKDEKKAAPKDEKKAGADGGKE